jgi:hypothetical protein
VHLAFNLPMQPTIRLGACEVGIRFAAEIRTELPAESLAARHGTAALRVALNVVVHHTTR